MNIKQIFEKYSTNISDLLINKFEEFLVIFKEKNSVVNLSAIRDDEGIIKKHFIDSIILNNFIKLSGNVLDIGTGGGFPGIPLAITNPEVQFVLIDSTHKKIDSVNDFQEKLQLKNCSGVWGRAEELSLKPEYKEQFDFIVSRATAYLPKIIEWSFPFLKKDGKIIIYKLNNKDEIKDGEILLQKLKLKISNIYEYNIDGQERILVEISKY